MPIDNDKSAPITNPIDRVMARSDDPFYAKFKRAKAGLPPEAPKPPQPLPKLSPNDLALDGLGPKWHRDSVPMPPSEPTRVPHRDYRSNYGQRGNAPYRPHTSTKSSSSFGDPPPGVSRIDWIRKNWRASELYPTYDAYLAHKRGGGSVATPTPSSKPTGYTPPSGQRPPYRGNSPRKPKGRCTGIYSRLNDEADW